MSRAGRWRRVGAAVAILSLLLPGIAVRSLAQSSADVTVSVVPPVDGVLTASIAGAVFEDVAYVPEGAADQVAYGTVQLRVRDTTGLGAPWIVRARAQSDFANGDRGTVSASNLRLARPDATAQRSLAPVPGNRPVPLEVPSLGTGAAVPVAACPEGNCQGEFTLAFPAALRVPAGTLAGTYRTTLVVEVLAAAD